MKDKHTKTYTAEALHSMRGASRTDWNKVDATTDEELEQLIGENQDEAGLCPDWTQAKLVLPTAKHSIHLRLEQEVISFFKAQGKGHISRMQAVLKAYVDSQRPRVK